MEMMQTVKDLREVMPVMAVKDDLLISRRGEVTVGWELSLPVAYTLSEKGYDDIVEAFAAAARLLPQWSVIHRQDVFMYESYMGEYGKGWLSDCYNAHFEGRRYLTHRQYLFLTMSVRGSVMKGNSTTAAFGIRFSAGLPPEGDIAQFLVKADEFISVVTSAPGLSARRLTDEEIVGRAGCPGLLDRYLMLGEETLLRSDVSVLPDKVGLFGSEMVGFKISEADELPGEVSDVWKDEDFASKAELYLSSSSALGLKLDCEHVVNQYVVMPAQGYVLQELDRKRKKMVSGSSSAENRVNAEQIGRFIDDIHKDGKLVCLSHMNVLAWGPKGSYLEIKGKVSSALSQMNVVATQALYDLPSLYLAGCPGGATEVGKDNWMTQELTSMLCMGVNETFETEVEGGLFQVVDRLRNIPLRIDIQRLARSRGFIDNYNVFLLGPSGSGKSFFTNYFLRQCYDAGEHIFIIDVGGSYEGLCQIIEELSCGHDGMYLAWDEATPFSFNPFIGYQTWVDGAGRLRQEEGGVTFMMSFLTTAWSPAGGWTSDTMAVLERVVRDFVVYAKSQSGDSLPIFDDFYRFVADVVAPRIVPVLDSRGEVLHLPEDPLLVAGMPVTPADFDVARFLRALVSYSSEGAYSFLLNDRNPRDLFASRFTVFEVDRLSEGDPLFYSLCVLCIMNAFDLKMRNSRGFKRMVVDEAWKAIANETMAPYLKGLWKTARKYQTSAMVVTQELDDIISSDVIKEAILQNSDTKVLLNQSKNANRFDQLSSLMGLSDHQKQLILSMGLAHNPEYFYTDCYIGMNSRYGIYSIEASKEEALAYESDRVKKAPLYERARQVGSIREAIEERVLEMKRKKTA